VPQLTQVQYPRWGGEGDGEPEVKWTMSGRQSTYFINGRELVTVATPTAAPAADRPTILSWLLALPSLTVLALCPPAHTSDTTNTSRLRPGRD